MNCPYCSEHMKFLKYRDEGKVKTYWYDCKMGCKRQWEMKELEKKTTERKDGSLQ